MVLGTPLSCSKLYAFDRFHQFFLAYSSERTRETGASWIVCLVTRTREFRRLAWYNPPQQQQLFIVEQRACYLSDVRDTRFSFFV